MIHVTMRRSILIVVCAILAGPVPPIAALELSPFVQIGPRDAGGGVLLDYGSRCTRTQTGILVTRHLRSDEFPVGAAVSVRQAFTLPSVHLFEAGLTVEADFFDPDAGLLVLPSAAADIGVRIPPFQRVTTFTLGYRYGFAEYEERHDGSGYHVRRVGRSTARPLVVRLIVEW